MLMCVLTFLHGLATPNVESIRINFMGQHERLLDDVLLYLARVSGGKLPSTIRACLLACNVVH